jgi:predicted secreted protein
MTSRALICLVACLALLTLSGVPAAQPPKGAPVDTEPRIAFKLGDNMRFGLTALKDAAGKAVNKQLTYSIDGKSNSTVIKVDDQVFEFGTNQGKWVEKDTKFPNGSKSVWVKDNIQVTQILEIVPSDQPVDIGGVQKRLLDTCLVTYVLENKDTMNHKVGLRIQVDTLIGTNDGVPFAVPNIKDLITTQKDFTRPQDVPDYVQALEFADLAKPGTVALMTFKVGRGLEPPGRVSLTHWPTFNFQPWEVPMTDINKVTNDSCVVLYWQADHELKANETRSLGFAYGLGRIAADTTGKLALDPHGPYIAGQNFTLTAYVSDPVKGQTLKLTLPAGTELVQGKATESVAMPTGGARSSTITWTLKATKSGSYTVKVDSSTGAEKSQTITVTEPVITDAGKLKDFTVKGDLTVGQVLTLTATVTHPVAGQELTLTLPAGLERTEGNLKQLVPELAKGHTSDDVHVVWKAKIAKAGTYDLVVTSNKGGKLSKVITVAEPKIADAGKLSDLAITGDLIVGKVFDIKATVIHLVPGQTVTLSLPAGLERVDGSEQQNVPDPAKGSSDSHVTWKAKALKHGQFTIHVTSNKGGMLSKAITIVDPDAGRIVGLKITGGTCKDTLLTVTATVLNPLPGQHLTLKLPAGLERTDGAEQQAVPQQGVQSTVVWKFKARQAGDFSVSVVSSNGANAVQSITVGTGKTDWVLEDVNRALQMAVENIPLDLCYDVNGDGQVTPADAAIILQKVLDRNLQGK